MSDPRPSNSYGKGYTVDYLGNMVGGLNQPIIEILAQLATQSIKRMKAFGLVVKFPNDSAKHGIEELQM